MNQNCPSTPDFIDCVKEIEELKKEYNLSTSQCLLLQISAAYECDGRNYLDLKEEFCK